MSNSQIPCCPECGKAAGFDGGVGWNPNSSNDEIIGGVQMTEEQRKALQQHLKDMRDKQEARINEMMTDSELAATLADQAKTLEGMELDGYDESNRPLSAPDNNYVVARDALRQSLDRLQTLLEAEWIDQQKSGRLSIRRWVAAQSPRQQLEVFRKYIPDEVDETGIDVVGLIDQSGSMGSMMDHASQVMWAIASAVRLTGNASTIIGFSDNAEVLIGRKQTLSDSMYLSFGTIGGTNPRPALEMADAVFADSEMPNRLLFIVTDGEWHDVGSCRLRIAEIAKNHTVDTVLVNLGYSGNDSRGCDHLVNAHDVDEMCFSLSEIITDITKRCAIRIAAETNREV